MTDTTLRYIATLQLLPVHPRKTTAHDIRKKLADSGHDVTVRTIERDLEKLTAVFPLHKDDRNKPFGWSWDKDASRVDIQAIDKISALTLTLARDHLAPLLPDSVIKVLAPRFAAAERMLASEALKDDVGRLPSRIRVKTRGQQLALPVIDHAVLECLYDALQLARRVRLTYKARKHAGKPKIYDADPLGIVFVDGVVYLVCNLHGSDGAHIAHLPVQRIAKIALLDHASVEPADFSLDAFVSEKFEYPLGDKPLKLVFRMAADTAMHLDERPLGKDQKITADDAVNKATVTVRVTVPDTQQLRWWLLGFGDRVEVLEPASLRAEFREIVATLAKAYKHQP